MSKKRPNSLQGKTLRARTPCGTTYLTLNFHNEELFEVRTTIGKCGTCQNINFFNMGVMISVLIQEDIAKDKIAKTLKRHFVGDKCGEKFEYEGKEYFSCFDWIGQMVNNEIEKTQT